MPAFETEHYTIEDYKLWQGDWELIYGNPLSMAPAPTNRHQFLATRISSYINNFIGECKECFVINEAEWRISLDTIVRPDVSFVCEKMDNYILKAPKIIFEISSPSTAKRDEITKKELYKNEKVEYYVLVYPNELKAKIFKLKNREYEKEGDFIDEKYIFETKCGTIEFDFNYIFGWFK